MLIQDQRRRFSPMAHCFYRVNSLTRPGGVFPDLHSFSVVVVAVDHRSGVCQNPGGLQQCERTETNEQIVGNLQFVPG
jgi:hypothetical protein